MAGLSSAEASLPDTAATGDTSPAFRQLHDQFTNVPQPCGGDAIVRFSLLYSQLYPHLNRPERAQAERFVDQLMEH
jgi:hypothetical protein